MTQRNVVIIIMLLVAIIFSISPTSSRPAPARQETARFLIPQKVAVLSAETNGLVTQIPYEPQDFVRKNDLLVQLDSDLVDIEIERVQHQIEMDTGIEKARILVEFREDFFRIQETLYNEILDEDSDDPNATRVGSRKEYQEAKQLYEDSLLEETRARLALIELKLNLRRYQKNQKQLTIRAPWDGVMVKFKSVGNMPDLAQYQQVEVGEMVQAGQPVLALMKVDHLRLLIQPSVSQLSRVHLGQQAKVTVRGYENTPIDARVVYIDPSLILGDKFNVEVEFANPLVQDEQVPKGVYRYRFRPGMWAEATLVFDNE